MSLQLTLALQIVKWNNYCLLLLLEVVMLTENNT